MVPVIVLFYILPSPVPSVAPGNLALIFSDGSLVLRWDRPSSVHPGVPVTYIVDINGTDPDTGMNFRNNIMTPEPMLSVAFLEEFLIGEECSSSLLTDNKYLIYLSCNSIIKN